MLNRVIRSIQGLMARRTPSTRSRSGHWRKRGIGFEQLERRELLAMVTVDNDFDDVNGNTSTIEDLEASPGPDGISLREAILAANADTTDPEDTVLFHEDLNGGVIRLTMSEDLDIQDSLTIDASTLTLGLTIDAVDPTPNEYTGTGKRIFDIESSRPSPIRITLKGLTLTGGDVSTVGGAIRLVGEKLTIEQSVITGNDAFFGGAIYADGLHNDGAELTVTDTVIFDNSAETQGGGIWALARGRQGTAPATIDISRSMITDNEAGTLGGGLHLRADKRADGDSSEADIRVSESTISGNETTGGSGEGGGLYAYLYGTSSGTAATITITGTTFSDNDAFRGGGAFLCVKHLAEANLQNSTFSGNSAAVSGGGIYLATLTSASFDTIFNAALRNITITDNRVGDTAPDRGAGLFIELVAGPTVNTLLHNTIVSNNRINLIGNPSNIGGRPVSQMSSHNLVGTGGDGGLINEYLGNQVGFDDPGLTALGQYGGPTATHYPLCGSPAVDAGNNVEIPTDPDTGMFVEWDQRGAFYKRVNDGTCGSAPDGSVVDIGAVERAGGDMDWDGDLDFDDIDDFVLGIADPAAYQEMYGTPSHVNGDFDCDGDQDFDDISGFVDCLSASLFGNLGERPRQIIESILENLIIRLVELYQESTSSQRTEVVELLFKDGSLARASDSIPLDDLLPPLDLLIQPPQWV